MHLRTSVRTYVCIYGPMYGSMYVHKVIWDISHQLPELINLFSILAATFPSPLIVPYPPWQYDYTWYPAFFYIHSLEPTYPTWGIGKSSSKVPWRGDTLVSRRVSSLTYPLNQKYQQKSQRQTQEDTPTSEMPLRVRVNEGSKWSLWSCMLGTESSMNNRCLEWVGWLVLTKERKGI